MTHDDDDNNDDNDKSDHNHNHINKWKINRRLMLDAEE